MLSQEAVTQILDIDAKNVPLSAEDMAHYLTVTFYPEEGQIITSQVKEFGEKLKVALKNIGVNVIPYEEALVELHPFYFYWRFAKAILNNIKVWVGNFLKISQTKHYITLRILSQIKRGEKIKKGVCVIALGTGKTGDLAMDNVLSFSHSTVVTALDMPEGIDEDTDFHVHFDTAFRLFAYHMTNIVLGVSKDKWILYNFNASHPIYPIEKNFEENLLNSLIPKLAAPIRPPLLSDFKIKEGVLDVNDKNHKPFIEDLMKSGPILEKTNLYPKGKSVHDLAFRNEFYEWVGRVHLDHRTGMSFGFLARQLPVKLPRVLPYEAAKKKFEQEIDSKKDYFRHGGEFYVVVDTSKGKFCLKVPEVWVITQRSGANKTNINPQEDILKMGLVNGEMILETPKGLNLTSYYKPSFDTKVILAHAVGNAIFATILKYLHPGSQFAKIMEKNGVAISHWHGYINPKFIPKGWYVYGQNNPPVSCSSHQSAIYAFRGKEHAFYESLGKEDEYLGDIHIEPQHGTNIIFSSLVELGHFLNSNHEISILGNKYLKFYK